MAGLKDKRVLITRPREDSAELAALFEERGAIPMLLPAIVITDPDSWEECDHAIINLKQYHGMLFTSRNAVERFLRRVDAINVDARRVLAQRRVYAVGEKTEAALEEEEIPVAGTPEVYSAEALADSFEGEDLLGTYFLFPRSSIGSNILPDFLRELGAVVDEVVVYKNVPPRQLELDAIRHALLNGEIDVATFFSPSAVRNFHQMMGTKALERTLVAVIGNSTASAAASLGMQVDIIARHATAESLVETIDDYFRNL